MSKHKSHGKDKKKSSQFVIRVDKGERDAFVTLCEQLDTSAAREIRRFMREFVAAHSGIGTPADGETENAKISDGNSDTPAIEGLKPAKMEADVDIPKGKAEKSKKTRKSIPK